jgi:hypothetical protein
LESERAGDSHDDGFRRGHDFLVLDAGHETVPRGTPTTGRYERPLKGTLHRDKHPRNGIPGPTSGPTVVTFAVLWVPRTRTPQRRNTRPKAGVPGRAHTVTTTWRGFGRFGVGQRFRCGFGHGVNHRPGDHVHVRSGRRNRNTVRAANANITVPAIAERGRSSSR